MKAWSDLTGSEKFAVTLFYGKARYIREWIAEQEAHDRMVAAVDNALLLGGRVFRARGKKK